MLWFLQPIYDELKGIHSELKSVNRKLAKLTIPAPGPFQAVRGISEENGTMKLEADLPTRSDAEKAEIASGELVKSFFIHPNGTESEVALDATVSPPFFAKEGTDATIGFYNLDNAGNKSTVSTQTFLVKDDIPPTAPGAFGAIRTLSEEDEPAPVE